MVFGYSDNERERLVRLAKGRRRVVEIGTGRGDSAYIILKTMPENGHLFTIDPLDGRSGGWIIESIPSETLFIEIQDKLAVYKDKYTLIVGLSGIVSELFLECSLDMVFIDAAHDYESVKNDILLWLPKVREGGVICGHDYECPGRECDNSNLIEYSNLDFYEGRHYGVIRAVDEIFEDVPHGDLHWWFEVT